MYAKLALRNVRRSAKDYLIYMVTLILSVSLFYGFLSIASQYYNDTLPVQIHLEILNKAMRIAVPIVALLVVFLINYVNTYMLRRKQKEFAVQTIIGMEQRTVALIFFMETIIMGAVAIVLGILLGMLLSQFISLIVVQSFGIAWELHFSLFPDTIFFTVLFFGTIFLVMGLKNIHTVRRLKIIDMLHNSQRGNEEFSLYKQLSHWVILSAATSIVVCVMMLALVTKVSLQVDIFWKMIALIGAAILFIVVSSWFFINGRKGKAVSVPLTIMMFSGLLQGINLLASGKAFESCVRQGIALQAYFTMPPIFAIILLIFSIIALFSNLSWLLTRAVKKSPVFYYNNLFMIGQLKSRLGSSAKTMGVIACVLIVSVVLMGWLPVNAIRAAEYQKITSPFDVQVLTTYQPSSENELPKDTLDYDYITDYLQEHDYSIENIATGELYLLQPDDIAQNIKKVPLLAVPLSSYNQLRALSGLPAITLGENEFGVVWSFDTLPSTIAQYDKDVQSIRAGVTTLNKMQGADYQDPTGMVVFTSKMQAVYIIPDTMCKNLLMATSFYAANTDNELSFDFAEQFDREMLIYQNGLERFQENQIYVRLSTLQDNEGISNSLLLRLVGTYTALVLIVICFTILSVQQLTDAIEQKKKFQIISKLGVEGKEQGRYVRQQMIFKFGLPVIVSLIFSIGALLFLTATGYDVYTVYISINQILCIFAVVYVVFLTILISYFMATYYLFSRTMK